MYPGTMDPTCTRWSEEVTIVFVKLYLENECLWNHHDRAYKDRESKRQAYANLVDGFRESTGLSLTPSQASQKIKSLRSTYSQEVRKVAKRSKELDRPFRSSLAWFELMHSKISIRSVVYVNKSGYSSNNDDASDKWENNGTNHDDTTTDHKWEPNGGAGSDSADVHEEEPLMAVEYLDSEIVNVKPELRSQSYTKRRGVVKLRKKRRLLRRATATRAHGPPTEVEAGTEDEFDIYGRHVAAQLRRLDLASALRLQADMNQLISAARLEQTL